MFLTKEEFAKIRNIRWRRLNASPYDKLYYVPADLVSRRLFNIDFLRYVFAPLFARQKAITRINKYDLDNDVFLGEDLELYLSNSLETVVYYARTSDAYGEERLEEASSPDERKNDFYFSQPFTLTKTTIFFSTLLTIMLVAMVCISISRNDKLYNNGSTGRENVPSRTRRSVANRSLIEECVAVANKPSSFVAKLFSVKIL
jgi:hypothetical protein